MAYTTYELHVVSTQSPTESLALFNRALDRLGVPQKVTSLEEAWSTRTHVRNWPGLVRLLLGGEPNPLFKKIFMEEFGVTPLASFGIDTEFENYEGSEPIALVVGAFLQESALDFVVVLNDSEQGASLEILRRFDQKLRFANWTHGALFEARVREQSSNV